MTPLHCSLSHPDGLPIIQLLISHGADQDTRDNIGVTPLLDAARYTQPPLMCRHLCDTWFCLLGVVFAFRTFALFLGAPERGQQHTREDADDRDDDEQFDEGEGPGGAARRRAGGVAARVDCKGGIHGKPGNEFWRR